MGANQGCVKRAAMQEKKANLNRSVAQFGNQHRTVFY